MTHPPWYFDDPESSTDTNINEFVGRLNTIEIIAKSCIYYCEM